MQIAWSGSSRATSITKSQRPHVQHDAGERAVLEERAAACWPVAAGDRGESVRSKFMEAA